MRNVGTEPSELLAPVRGVDRSTSFAKQNALTTDDAVNVLAIDPNTGELRLSSRPGLSRVGSALVGAGQVQDLEQLSYANPALVTYTPAADGGTFLGTEEWAVPSGNATTIMAETYDAEGNRYAIDMTGSLFKVSLDGKVVWLVTIAKKYGLHKFRGIAVGSNGDVYVGVGRDNRVDLLVAGIEELEKKGQEKARIYRYRQIDLAENVQTAQLAWEYVTGRYIVDMKTSGGYLITLEEDIGQTWAWAYAYQTLTAGAPTVRWKRRIPYPCNSLAVGSDGMCYIACEPVPLAVASSPYGQSTRNARATVGGFVGPVHEWTVDELKKYGFRKWSHYRADQVTLEDLALADGAEVIEWRDISGNGRHLTVPSGTFSFGTASNIEAQGPRLVKKGPNGLPEVRFLGITGATGTPSSLRFQGLVSDPPDDTAEQSEFENRSALPSYENCAFLVIMVLRPEFGAISRQAVLAQDYRAEAGVAGGGASADIPLVIAVNQQNVAGGGGWNTTTVGGQITVADQVYTGGAGGANATSPPNGDSYAAGFNVPLSISGQATENGTFGLPHGYCVVAFLCDGKFTGAFQNDTTFLGTMSQVYVNGTVLDRYGSHKHRVPNTTVYPNTTVGWAENGIVDMLANNETFEPFRGGILEILVLNRYDKNPITGLHGGSSDAASVDPIIASHYLLPNDNTLVNVPGDTDDRVTYNVTDQVAGASTVTTDEVNLLMGSMSWDWGFECLPRTDDAAGPPFNYKQNVFAKDPCVNRGASGAPPLSTEIAFGGPRDPNWINYPHGMVIKLNGDDGSQVWVAADYTAGNNKGLGVGIALVQDYNGDETAPSVRKLVSYGPDKDFKDAFARVLTDNGETVTLGATIPLYTTPIGTVVLRDRYPKCGADQFGNALIPGNFQSNFGPSSGATATDSAFSLAVVKKDGTVRLHYDVTSSVNHQPVYCANPDPVSPAYPSSVDKLARFVVLALDKNLYNPAAAIATTTLNCLRKIKLVDSTPPSGVPRVTEYLALCGGHLKKYTEVAGVLVGPTALTPAGPYLSTLSTSTLQRIVVGLEKAVIFDGKTTMLYDPKLSGDTVVTLRAKKGRLPERCLLGAFWMGSLVLGRPSDSPTEIFMSRTGELTDWDFDPPTISKKQAVRLQNRVGPLADPVTALIPMRDDLMLIGGERSISRLTGHPMDNGRFDNISTQVGILFGDAWTRDPEGNLYFVSNSLEVCIATEASGIRSISGDKIRNALQEYDLSLNRIMLGWDALGDMLVLFQVPYTTLGTLRSGWVWQRGTDGWFEIDFETAGVQPTCALTALGDTSGVRRILFGCEDGWVRGLNPAFTYDEASDGSKKRIFSRVNLGPIVLDGGTRVAVTRARVIMGDTDAPTDAAQGGIDIDMYVSDSSDVVGAPVASQHVNAGHNPTFAVGATGCIAKARVSNANVNERFAIQRVLLEVEEAGDFAP